jgi:Domain of unknown function (DUF4430)
VKPPRLLAAAAAICAAAVAGCGLGPGEHTGDAELTISRDYGAQRLHHTEVGLRESDTVISLLDRSADIETRYGGGFVQSIDGLAGGNDDGRHSDWFFYVNGIESPIGGAEYDPGDGDRVWWDYRDWSSAIRVPAVVGAFPEPFEHGFEGKTYTTRIDCLGEVDPCKQVQSALEHEGVKAGVFEAEHAPGYDAEAGPTLRILVGPWDQVGDDPAAALIEGGPAQSGVFARFQGGAGHEALVGLSDHGTPSAGPFGPDAGLVAAVRFEDRPPTWVVTAAGPQGVRAAAAAFSAGRLHYHYAVIAQGSGASATTTPVPRVTQP